MRKSKGFSLTELLIVVAIISILTAVSVPSIWRTVKTYRLQGHARGVSDLLQRARYEAIKRNKTIAARLLNGSDPGTVYIDLDGNNAMGRTEPRALLASGMAFLGSGSVPSTDSMGYGLTTVPSGIVAFDSRGTVDYLDGAPAVYVVFVGFPEDSSCGYRAISLTPAGRMRMWKAEKNGSWSDQ